MIDHLAERKVFDFSRMERQRLLKEVHNSSGFCGDAVMGKDQLEKASLDLATESAVKMRYHVMEWVLKQERVEVL